MSFYDDFDDDKYYQEKKTKKVKPSKQQKFKYFSEDDDFELKKGKAKTSHERKQNRSLKNND